MGDSIQFEVTKDGDLELVISPQIWKELKAAATSGQPGEAADGSIRIRVGHGDLTIKTTQPSEGDLTIEAIPPTLQPGCQALLTVVGP